MSRKDKKKRKGTLHNGRQAVDTELVDGVKKRKNKYLGGFKRGIKKYLSVIHSAMVDKKKFQKGTWGE